MQFGVEIDTRCGIYGLFAVLFKIFNELVVNQLNALAYRRCIVARLNGLKRALEIVDYRKGPDPSEHLSRPFFISSLFSLSVRLRKLSNSALEQILLLLLFSCAESGQAHAGTRASTFFISSIGNILWWPRPPAARQKTQLSISLTEISTLWLHADGSVTFSCSYSCRYI